MNDEWSEFTNAAVPLKLDDDIRGLNFTLLFCRYMVDILQEIKTIQVKNEDEESLQNVCCKMINNIGKKLELFIKNAWKMNFEEQKLR